MKRLSVALTLAAASILPGCALKTAALPDIRGFDWVNAPGEPLGLARFDVKIERKVDCPIDVYASLTNAASGEEVNVYVTEMPAGSDQKQTTGLAPGTYKWNGVWAHHSPCAFGGYRFESNTYQLPEGQESRNRPEIQIVAAKVTNLGILHVKVQLVQSSHDVATTNWETEIAPAKSELAAN